MDSISPKKANSLGLCTVAAAWLAVFCLFGYRSSFSVMQKLIIADTGWTTIQTSLGYCIMMSVYAVTAFFSGSLVDKKGSRTPYIIGAVCCFLGFFLTSLINAKSPTSLYTFFFTYGLFAGIGTGMLWVASTISCRKWYVGARYGTMWGLAFMGAPMAQLLLTLVLKPILSNMGWQFGMKVLAVIMAIFLIIAAIVAKKPPTAYGLEPFGAETLKNKGPMKNWQVGEAFRTFPIWCVTFAFLTALIGEFLVWSQVVAFFQTDMGLSLNVASNIYIIIGIAGIFSMPLTGRFSDYLVRKFGNERKARKTMLMIGPVAALIGTLLLFSYNITLCCVAMVILAVYWGIQPGGCAGYAGSVYGGPGLGKIWGLATLISMGIGPSFGTFMGAWFKDTYGSYVPALIFCVCMFILSAIFAVALPTKLKSEQIAESEKVTA